MFWRRSPMYGAASLPFGGLSSGDLPYHTIPYCRDWTRAAKTPNRKHYFFFLRTQKDTPKIHPITKRRNSLKQSHKGTKHVTSITNCFKQFRTCLNNFQRAPNNFKHDLLHNFYKLQTRFKHVSTTFKTFQTNLNTLQTVSNTSQILKT